MSFCTRHARMVNYLDLSTSLIAEVALQSHGAAQSLAMGTALERGRGLQTASMGRLTTMRGRPSWLRAAMPW